MAEGRRPLGLSLVRAARVAPDSPVGLRRLAWMSAPHLKERYGIKFACLEDTSSQINLFIESRLIDTNKHDVDDVITGARTSSSSFKSFDHQ